MNASGEVCYLGGTAGWHDYGFNGGAGADGMNVPNLPNWNDWAVRLAAAYDLTGDGKTALKGNAGKYVAAQAAGFAQNFNGMSGATQTRSWNDANGDKTILNADGSIQVNEVIGGTSNFGQITSRPDSELKRGYNWEYSAVLQRELRPRLSVTAGYYKETLPETFRYRAEASGPQYQVDLDLASVAAARRLP